MDDFQALRRLPIPPPRFDENVPVPPPQECGEPLVDLTGASPRLQYAASYRSRGVPHAPARCWLRKTAAAMLVQAAEALPPGWSLLGYDSPRPLAGEQGQALPLDFLWKILFTALTLGAGYKGGEVVPSFFVGATFGCVAAPLLGLPAGFGAALGLAAVFCGATNCLVPSIVLAVELFGAPGLLYYAIVCGVSYTLSGYSGLYSHQHFLTDKLGTEYRSEIHPHHPAGFGNHPPL